MRRVMQARQRFQPHWAVVAHAHDGLIDRVNLGTRQRCLQVGFR